QVLLLRTPPANSLGLPLSTSRSPTPDCRGRESPARRDDFEWGASQANALLLEVFAQTRLR
ncbi:MAG: hypothetical protein ACK559_09630, partial [bacterium]